jgi:hypothetical protein
VTLFGSRGDMFFCTVLIYRNKNKYPTIFVLWGITKCSKSLCPWRRSPHISCSSTGEWNILPQYEMIKYNLQTGLFRSSVACCVFQTIYSDVILRAKWASTLTSTGIPQISLNMHRNKR